MTQRVEVHHRISDRHPDVLPEDVEAAWKNAVSARVREFGPPDVVTAAGPDTKGRMLELVGIEMDDGSVLIYHAMRLTRKMAAEPGL